MTDGLPENQAKKGACEQRGTIREGLAPSDSKGEPGDGSHDKPSKQPGQAGAPADPAQDQAKDRGEFHVSQAHRLLTQEDRADEKEAHIPREPQQPRQDRSAPRCAAETSAGRKGGAEQAQDGYRIERVGEGVGQPQRGHVGDDQSGRHGEDDKEEEEQRVEAQRPGSSWRTLLPCPPSEERRHDPGTGFDEWVSGADRRVAVVAPSAQQQPA